jgi:hypothetical protein
MADFKSCENCEREVTADSDFCPHCGFLCEGSEKVECDVHPSVEAIGVCIVCQRALCELCGEINGDRLLCSEHLEVVVEDDWAEVLKSTDINEAELSKAILESAGFQVQVRDFGPIGFAWDGGGDSSLSRSQLGKPARVFVPVSEFLQARETLRDWESSEPS